MSELSLQSIVSNFLRHSISYEYNLNTYERFIIRFLADYIGNNKEWIISQSKLALDIATTRKTINQNIQSLLRKQLVFQRSIIGRPPYYSLVIPIIRNTAEPKPDPVILFHSNPEYTCNPQLQGMQNYSAIPVTDSYTPVTDSYTPCNPQLHGCNPQLHIYNSNNPINNSVIIPREEVFSPVTNNHTPKPKKKRAPKKEQPIELPPWLSQCDWDNYVQFRKEIKKPMTHRAKELALKTLEEFRHKGMKPEDVINKSIMNGWAGLFEIKQSKNGFTKNGESYAEQLERATNIVSKARAREAAGAMDTAPVYEVSGYLDGEVDKEY